MKTKQLFALVGRNIKCYFKDRFLFLVSLITPMILLVLFVTFLRSVYTRSAADIMAGFGIAASARALNGFAGAWLLSSVLSVSAVTVAICSNAVMVNDRADGVVSDFLISPVRPVILQLSYAIANFAVTMLVMLAVMAVGLAYIAAVGWYLTAASVFAALGDLILSVLFGTLIAGVVESFISTGGALSALSTLMSSMYGFVCGAYMPLSQFQPGVRNFLGALPGTSGVSIMRGHFLGDFVNAMAGENNACRDMLLRSFDARLTVGGVTLPQYAMYIIFAGTCAVLFVAYALIIAAKSKSMTLRVKPKRRKKEDGAR